MKKLLRTFMLTAALMLLLCVSAMAASSTTSGMYGFAASSGVTLTPSDSTASTVTIGGVARNDFYSGAVKFSFSYTHETNIVDGGQYLIMVCSGSYDPNDSTTLPNANNIFYIDQAAASGTTVSFATVYPKTMSSGHYRVYLVGPNQTFNAAAPIAQFEYGEPYTLGDVDGENGLNSYDASLILQHLVHTYDFVGNGALAADVDGENGVNSYDASLILQHLVHTYTIPGWEE